MEKRGSVFHPVLVTKQPITSTEPITGEVAVLLVCSKCGKGIQNLSVADLVLDIDVHQPPGNLIDTTQENEFMYSLVGQAHVVHLGCDSDSVGVRINAGEWAASGGRTRYRPTFAQRKKETIN